MDGKECTRCYLFLLLKEFYTQPNAKDGHQTECKECGRKRKRKYRKYNLEKIRLQDRERCNKDKQKRKLQGKRSYERRRDRILIQKKEYYASEHGSKIKRLYSKKFMAIPKNRIRNAIATRIRRTLKHGAGFSDWRIHFAYTIEELKKHLEHQFAEGMSWSNYGLYGWHIDHKIPVSYFNFSSPQDAEFKKCWALSNLQPLWAKENMLKGNKLIYLEGENLKLMARK